MATEGTDVMAALQADLEAVGSDLTECEKGASRLDGQMRELLSQRGENLVQLARIYLPEISPSAIERTFQAIRGDLLGILARKDSRQCELKAQLLQIETDTAERTRELDDVTRRLNEKVARREQLEAQVAETLKGDRAFQKRSKLALQAEENLHRNEQRIGDIETESAKKLPFYEKSRLFLYLYERRFGSLEYKAREWTRGIDAWVARLIGYNDARMGYEYLKKTPKLVGEEVARRRDQFNALMQQVEALQHEEADKAGLTAILGEGDALGTERDRLVQEIDQLRQHAESANQALADLAASQNQFHTEAIEKFRGFLSETKLAILQKRARETPEPDDDKIVADLMTLDGEIQDINPRLSELNEQRQTSERIRQGLDIVAARCRQANFDSPRSYFTGSFDVRRLVDRFRDGLIDADTLWQEIRSAQKFRPHWVESRIASGTEALTSPAGRVLMGAICNAANAALQVSASRSVQRRESGNFPSQSYPSSPTPQAPPSYSPPSNGGGDGFTTIDGF